MKIPRQSFIKVVYGCVWECILDLRWWRGVCGNAFDPINEVTVRRARLVLRWVTACRQVNHFGM